MIPVDKAVVARLDKGKKQFEILVDPDLVQGVKEQLKKGKNADVSSIMAIDAVFTDSKKGLRASKQELMAELGVEDIIEAATKIISEGVIHTTSAQRDKETQDKWDRIVALISTNAIDARTKKPIPKATIEDALHQAKFVVDKRKKVEDQLQDAIKGAKKILALAFQERTIQLTNVPAHLAGSCLEICKKRGTIEKETWGQDKSLTLVIKVPAGMREDLMNMLNDTTRGKIDIKLLD